MVCRIGTNRTALWKTNVRMITQEFMYKALWKKLQVRQRVQIVKDITDGCGWCGVQETMYHFMKSCNDLPTVHSMTTPVAQGVDVGRWVADKPLISLTQLAGLCVW